MDIGTIRTAILAGEYGKVVGNPAYYCCVVRGGKCIVSILCTLLMVAILRFCMTTPLAPQRIMGGLTKEISRTTVQMKDARQQLMSATYSEG